MAFAGWGGHKIYLALDSSSLWDEFVLVRVALIYGGRALPLSWVILKQQSTMMAFEQYQHILKEAAAILPTGCPVILPADRGFDDNDLGCALRDLGWGSRIRLKKSLRVYRVSKPVLSVGRLMPAQDRLCFCTKFGLRIVGLVRCISPWRMDTGGMAMKNGLFSATIHPICLPWMNMACGLTGKKISWMINRPVSKWSLAKFVTPMRQLVWGWFWLQPHAISLALARPWLCWVCGLKSIPIGGGD